MNANTIEYKGIECFDNDWLSSYLIGIADHTFIHESYSFYKADFVCDHNRALLECKIVRRYMKRYIPLMYSWLGESNISCGGHLTYDYTRGRYNMFLLLRPKSIEEMAFRLCFGVSGQFLPA